MQFDPSETALHSSIVGDYIEGFMETEEWQSMTKEQQDDWFFAAKRLYGLGGSDIAVLLKLSPWKTPFQLWQEKTCRVAPEELQTSNVFTHWGKLLEDTIRQEYKDLIGHYYGDYKTAPVFKVPEHPQIICNLDGLIIDKAGHNLRVHEIKTAMTNAYSGDRTSDGREILNWGEGNEYVEDETGMTCFKEDAQIPAPYRVQVETYMMAAGVDVADVSVLIGHHDFRTFTVHANKELQEKITEAADKFWLAVLKDQPPELITADLKKVKPDLNAVSIDGRTGELWAQYMDLRRYYKALGEKKDAMEDQLKCFIGKHEALTDAQGRVLATWKMSAARKAFDKDKFKAENPELYAKYITTTQGSRRFLVKQGSE